MRRSTCVVAFLVFGAAAIGCGRPAPSPTQPGSARAPAAPQPALPADAGASADSAAAPAAESPPTSNAETPGTPIGLPLGRIEGTVTFAGEELPTSTVVQNGTDPQICGTEMSKFDMLISPQTRGIQNVLVGLEDVKLPEGYKPPTATLILDNKNCQFVPHAAVLTVGSTIETRNSDEVYHTTNLSGSMSENIPLTMKGTKHTTRVRRAGLIAVKCDKHGWMQAFIRVDPHPFHAVTDESGKFTIADVPVGTYKLKAWHEVFYGQDVEVTVKENEATRIELKYPVAGQE